MNVSLLKREGKPGGALRLCLLRCLCNFGFGNMSKLGRWARVYAGGKYVDI